MKNTSYDHKIAALGKILANGVNPFDKDNSLKELDKCVCPTLMKQAYTELMECSDLYILNALKQALIPLNDRYWGLKQ